MRNPESHSVTKEEIVQRKEVIPPDAALDAQRKLIVHMTPERIIPYIDFNDDYDPFLEALWLRYMQKYDSGDYNGFREFCTAADDAFRKRVMDKKIEIEDLDAMKAALIAHDSYTPFFADEGEVVEFIKANTH